MWPHLGNTILEYGTNRQTKLIEIGQKNAFNLCDER